MMGQYAIEKGIVCVWCRTEKIVSTHLKCFFCTMKHLNSKQKERLEKVSKKEWQQAMDEVKRLVNWRLYGSKTCSGAHSETLLGMPAADHYVGETV